MSGETGVTVVTTACVLFSFARKAAGAPDARHSLRPLFQGSMYRQTSDALCRENDKLYPRHCFASLAMTAQAVITREGG
jgi:hypothetical protein